MVPPQLKGCSHQSLGGASNKRFLWFFLPIVESSSLFPYAWLPVSQVIAWKSKSVRVTVKGPSTLSESMYSAGVMVLFRLFTLQEFRGRIAFWKRCKRRKWVGLWWETKVLAVAVPACSTGVTGPHRDAVVILTCFRVPVSLQMATMAQMRICRQQVAPMHTPKALPHSGNT